MDYGIASYDLFDKISNFTVRPESYLSDHCQIATWLNIGALKQKHDDSWKDNLYKLSNLFKFKCQNKASFLKALGTKDIQLKIRNFIDHQYLLTEKGLQDANKDFSDIIISAAKMSLSTIKRKFIKKSVNIKKRWFNKEREITRKILRKSANQKHRNPENKNLRVAHSQSIKEFKMICKTQRCLFWDKKIENLKLNCKDNVNKNFWNIWKDFQEDISLPQKDGSVWEIIIKIFLI